MSKISSQKRKAEAADAPDAEKKLRHETVKKEEASQKKKKAGPEEFPWETAKVNEVAEKLGFFNDRGRFVCRTTKSVIDFCLDCAACSYEPCFVCGGTYKKHKAKCAFAAGNYIRRDYMWLLEQQLLKRSDWIEDWLEGSEREKTTRRGRRRTKRRKKRMKRKRRSPVIPPLTTRSRQRKTRSQRIRLALPSSN
jgi:hypothetical protein